MVVVLELYGKSFDINYGDNDIYDLLISPQYFGIYVCDGAKLVVKDLLDYD